MTIDNAKKFFRTVYVTNLICLILSVALIGTEYSSALQAWTMGIIFFLVAVSHKSALSAETITTKDTVLYAFSFVASLFYIAVIFFNLGRHFIRGI